MDNMTVKSNGDSIPQYDSSQRTRSIAPNRWLKCRKNLISFRPLIIYKAMVLEMLTILYEYCFLRSGFVVHATCRVLVGNLA